MIHQQPLNKSEYILENITYMQLLFSLLDLVKNYIILYTTPTMSHIHSNEIGINFAQCKSLNIQIVVLNFSLLFVTFNYHIGVLRLYECLMNVFILCVEFRNIPAEVDSVYRKGQGQ